jgi:hypothetical protein
MIDTPASAESMRHSPNGKDPLALIPAFAGTPPTWWRTLPWSVTRSGDALLLRAEQLQDELLGDPANREVLLACGAVLANLKIAAHHLGHDVRMELFPDGTGSPIVARLTVGREVSPGREDEALFDVLEHGVRSLAHGGTSVSPALVAILRHGARSEGGWLDVVSDDARRAIVGDLESEAVAITDAERSARRLLSARYGAGTLGPQFALGGAPALGELLYTLGASVQPVNEWSAGRAAKLRESALEAPLLAVLGATDDTPRGWLRAGAALQRVLLHASVQGLSATFLNEPLRHPLLRDALRSVLFADGAPQAIVRFDFSSAGSARDAHRRGGRTATAA